MKTLLPASGRLGSIGHVSIEDHQAEATGGDGSGYWLRRGGPLLARACELLGTEAQEVMARIDERSAVTEAYLVTRRGVHVHFSGLWNADVDSHCLWIEGTGGSLRVDVRALWWRKRGWRFFLPIRPAGSLLATPGRAAGDIAAAALASAARRQSEPVR
jgi:predicted dehydrogenase